MKPFEKWKTEEVERTFGIELMKNTPVMNDWLHFSQPLTSKEQERAEELRLFIEEFASLWNEEDMKVFFIVPVLQIVNFYSYKKYRTFMEATFHAKVLDVQNKLCTLRGRVEMVVATGKQDPQIPFFFLNKYKAQIKVTSDPQGQLLSAMIAAQAKNEALNLPVYGMYNIGQLWFFVVLQDKEYTVSKAFDATDKDALKQIINMLQYVKAHIERNV
jgi:hypothetical protein